MCWLQDANATFSNCNFSNNHGTAWGELNSYGLAGAIDLNMMQLILTQCSFNNNRADLNGGAIYAKTQISMPPHVIFRITKIPKIMAGVLCI